MLKKKNRKTAERIGLNCNCEHVDADKDINKLNGIEDDLILLSYPDAIKRHYTYPTYTLHIFILPD